MNLRIICVQVDCAVAANVGGPVETSHKTFDIPAPEVIKWLHEYLGKNSGKYLSRAIVGVEVLEGDQP